MQIRALALDVFGTLIQYGQRLAPYSRLVGARGKGAARLPFLTRDVPVATFAAELGLEHLLPNIEADLAEELVGLRLFAEVPEMLTRARCAGLRLAVCSNLASEYGPAVRSLLPSVDACVLSYEVGLAKPDPAIYQRVCDALGCVPGEVVFVGDSKRCDVHGPLAFGMQARHLDRRAGESLLDVLADLLLTCDGITAIGNNYDALRANPDRGLLPDDVHARLATTGSQILDIAAIPRRRETMTRDELTGSVPVHDYEGRPFYVSLDEIPQPWQAQFWAALQGSQCPKIDGVERAAYALDWQCWVNGRWYGRHGPEGLDAEPANMHVLHRLSDYPVLATLARECTEAIKLDGRACRYVYEAALPRIDWKAVSANERAFMHLLGIKVQP